MIRSARDDAGERLNGHRSGLAPITEKMTKRKVTGALFLHRVDEGCYGLYEFRESLYEVYDGSHLLTPSTAGGNFNPSTTPGKCLRGHPNPKRTYHILPAQQTLHKLSI